MKPPPPSLWRWVRPRWAAGGKKNDGLQHGEREAMDAKCTACDQKASRVLLLLLLLAEEEEGEAAGWPSSAEGRGVAEEEVAAAAVG